MDPKRSITITSALRYWGCAIQAGTQISGALGFAPQSSSISQEVAGKFTPLSVGTLPYLLIDSSLDWDAAISSLSQDTEDLLTTTHKCSHPSVTFDTSQKSVKLFMPGFDKSEIKLYQVCHLIHLSVLFSRTARTVSALDKAEAPDDKAFGYQVV